MVLEFLDLERLPSYTEREMEISAVEQRLIMEARTKYNAR